MIRKQSNGRHARSLMDKLNSYRLNLDTDGIIELLVKIRGDLHHFHFSLDPMVPRGIAYRYPELLNSALGVHVYNSCSIPFNNTTAAVAQATCARSGTLLLPRRGRGREL